MNHKHTMSRICLMGLLMLPAWTILLWWLRERIVVAVAILALLGIGLILQSFLRIHVAPPGLGLICARCGYDLRGNHSGVCPECGQGVR